MKTIQVKAANPTQVALFERHRDHPTGEVYIVGKKVVEVAPTPAVVQRLHQGILVEVEAPEGKKPTPESGDEE